jgi:twinkle protein
MATAKEMNAMLANKADTVARYLLPNGRRRGHEWEVGSLGGEAGKSLKVPVSGPKVGGWRDFATGESGDLVDLWAEIRGMDISGAMREVGDWLGIGITARVTPAARKSYSKPNKPVQVITKRSAVTTYLTEARLLTPDTVKAFRIGEDRDNIHFPFYDDDGELVMVKWRSIREKKCGVTEANMQPCLFGWQAVGPRERTVAICEGEIDAMTLHEYGITALSVPFGGGSGEKQSWIEHEYDRLERFDEIYLCMDQDEPGQQAVGAIIDRLGRHRCRIVELPHKDANECLLNGVPQSVIQAAFESAKSRDPDHLKNIGDVAEAVIAAMGRDDSNYGIKTPWDKVKTLRFRPSEVTVIAGVNGHGKTEGVNQLAIDAVYQGYRVCVATLELTTEQLGMRLKDQVCANANPTPDYVAKAFRWLSRGMWTYEPSGTADVKTMMDVLAYARNRYGIDLFVIDNLTKLNINLDDFNNQRNFLDTVTEFAKTHKTHVFIVAHHKKMQDESTPGGKFDIKGSGAITDLADNVINWWRNKPKEEALKNPDLPADKRKEWEEKYDAIVRCDKQRHGTDEPVIFLWWHQQARQYLPFRDSRPIEYLREFEE